MNKFFNFIKKKQKQLDDDLAGNPYNFRQSTQIYSLTRKLFPLFNKYISGTVVDAGAGKKAYKEVVESITNDYIAIDIKKTSETRMPDILCDMQDISIKSETIDTVLCVQALQHAYEPFRVIKEFYRILKPGGILILSAPHLVYMHDIPHDFYRFTDYGLKYLAEKAGFTVLETYRVGGLLSLICHIPSTLMIILFQKPVILKNIVRTINYYFVKSVVRIETLFDPDRIYAKNIIIVARKSNNSGVKYEKEE
ncbi:MAG: class I SAM-dependent methyltransferase [Candidatus Aureabacteria bacterium]|nr:class I SAM-dependent methyltransferase [Candidatus Auribacterota bacterium]